MAAGKAKAQFEPLRSAAFGDIGAAYVAIVGPLDYEVRAFCITNTTNSNLIFSFDDDIEEGQIFVAAGSYKLWDVQSNENAQFDDKFVIPKGSVFYVKREAAPSPTSGNVYIECLY